MTKNIYSKSKLKYKFKVHLLFWGISILHNIFRGNITHFSLLNLFYSYSIY